MQYLTWFGGLAIIWVILQFLFIGSSRSIPIEKTIKIHLDEFRQHAVKVVQHQQIPFVLIHRTEQQILQLEENHQNNALRSIQREYFIALAIGTDLGCVVLEHSEDVLKESCSQALYDFSGRPIGNNKIEPLNVPLMTYNKQSQLFSLTLK